MDTNNVNAKLNELIQMWIDGSAVSLQHIPGLCDEITEIIANRAILAELDRSLLRRVALLSVRAESRLAACLAIQTRTGAYSTHGVFETLPRVVTTNWEG
jgi:hypothetical protein